MILSVIVTFGTELSHSMLDFFLRLELTVQAGNASASFGRRVSQNMFLAFGCSGRIIL